MDTHCHVPSLTCTSTQPPFGSVCLSVCVSVSERKIFFRKFYSLLYDPSAQDVVETMKTWAERDEDLKCSIIKFLYSEEVRVIMCEKEKIRTPSPLVA